MASEGSAAIALRAREAYAALCRLEDEPTLAAQLDPLVSVARTHAK